MWSGPPGGELPAMEKGGGGQETSSPSRTFAAGDQVVGAPKRGAADHEEGGGGQETRSPAALSRQERVWREPQKRELPATKNGGVPEISPWPPPRSNLLPPLPGLKD
ncbi:UNVERIFIED_CONTAM: hypothetical protein FKN15_060147 [Acipenser sinensis]